MTEVNSRASESRARSRDADLTKSEILEAALDEFATHGLAGARTEEIAARTRVSKRMLHYYFESKEGLYAAVLERAYEEIKLDFLQLDLAQLHPIEAIKQVAACIYHHYETHPQFVRLVITENLHKGKFLDELKESKGIYMPSLELLDVALRKGQERGIFRRYVDAIDLQTLIDSFCFFRVSNQHTFKTLYGREMMAADKQDHYELMLQDLVVAYLTFGKIY